MPTLRPLILSLVIGTVIGLVLALAACDGNGPRGNIDRSILAYDQHEYTDALRLAKVASDHATTTKDAHEASYMAGMSAYQLNDFASAERWLTDAARSSDAWTAGEAGVMLGNTQLRLKKPADAARSFSEAARHFDGENANRARIAAANAYREAGNQRAADEQFRLAHVPTTVTVDAPPRPAPSSSSSSSPAPPKTVSATTSASPSSGAFVIQAGAFRDATKAKKRADELRAKSVRAGLGEPRIASKKASDGSLLWVVQIGGFADRSAADSAVTKLGANGVVVSRAVAAG